VRFDWWRLRKRRWMERVRMNREMASWATGEERSASVKLILPVVW
jgi:hypothetical protein